MWFRGARLGLSSQYKRRDGHVRVVRVLGRRKVEVKALEQRSKPIGTSQGTTAGARSEPDMLEPVKLVGQSYAGITATAMLK